MTPKPRICMPTWRGFKKVAFQGGLYEAQDVLTQIDAVDLLHLEPAPGFRTKEQWQRRLLWRDVSRRLIFKNPGLKRVRLNREYDLFVLVCQNWWDLLYVNALEGWKDHCRTSVCYIDELWTGLLPSYKYWLHAFNQFDHVIVGLSGDRKSTRLNSSHSQISYAVFCLKKKKKKNNNNKNTNKIKTKNIQY